MGKKIVGGLKTLFFNVSVPKEVRVWSCALTLIKIFCNLGALAAIIAWVFARDKHLEYDTGETTILTKVRGVAYTNFPKIPGLYKRVWDAADYVYPPLENGAKFIMTNIVITPRQTQGVCEEDPSVLDALCNSSHPCQPGQALKFGHGVMTGKCVASTRVPGTRVCEVQAWCPVEQDDETTQTATPAFMESENFTIFVSNSVRFPRHNQKRQNIPSYVTDEHTSCMYDPDHSEYRHCPVFRIGHIVQLAGYSFDDVAEEGGVFHVSISWKCNSEDLDNCWPTYSFARLDEMNSTGVPNWQGFRFRYADHSDLPDGSVIRTLYKAIGIRLIFTSEATASRWDCVKIVLGIGSLLSFIRIVNAILTWVFSCCVDDKIKYEDDDTKDSLKEVTGFGDCCYHLSRMNCRWWPCFQWRCCPCSKPAAGPDPQEYVNHHTVSESDNAV